MAKLAAMLRKALAEGEPAVLVTVESALGSTPREAGAAMLVGRAGIAGTIGGGALEFMAIERARSMLAEGDGTALGEEARSAAMDVPLGPDIGQCCGGRVALSLRLADAALLAEVEAAEAALGARRPSILVFGAGHTGRALAAALAPLPFRVRLIDARPETLTGLPEAVETVAAALPEAEVAAAPPASAFVVMTHDHSLDFLIASAALARGDAAYVGMIGSATKREQFRRHLHREGLGATFPRLTLPIGGSAVRDKRPEVIAALTAAELVTCLSHQQEKPADRFAPGSPRCNSAGTDQRDHQSRHAAAS